MTKKTQKNTAIIILVILLILILWYLIKKKTNKIIIDIPPELLESGEMTNTEINALCMQLHEHLTGITIYNEEMYLQKILALTDIDFVRVANQYSELYEITLFSVLNDEWYWSGNSDLLQAVNNRFIKFQINI